MRLNRQLLVTFVLLGAVLGLFEFTSLDLLLQDQFYDRTTGHWMVDSTSPLPRFFFYTGAKGAIILFAVLLAVFFLWPRRKLPVAWTGRKRDAGFLLLCLGVVPLVIGELKASTNIYCPYQLTRYGGTKPYIKVFDSRAAAVKGDPGRCYPAGHASGGFALMGLLFVARTWRRRIMGILAGQTVGWTMALYQMFKGAHFLSHSLVTMLLAWMLILLLAKWIRPSALQPLPDHNQ